MDKCFFAYINSIPLQVTTNQILSSYREYGILIYKGITWAGNYISFLIFKSTPNLSNLTGQPSTSGALTIAQSGTVVGNFNGINVNDADSLYMVFPNYGLIVHLNSGYTGLQLLYYKNTTS